MMASGTSFLPPAAYVAQAQPRVASLPCVGRQRRLLEPCQPGRVAPPTWALAAAAVEYLTDRPLEEELREAIIGEESKSQKGLYNQSGLNGLATSGTAGLDTGVFEVAAAQPVNYTIHEVEDLFHLDNETLLRNVVPNSFPSRLSAEAMPAEGQRRFIVIDDNIFRIHGERIQNYFDTKGMEVKILPLPTKEANKSFDLVYDIARELETFGINRRKEPIIAIGGGVCLDIAGLAANLYRRNTPIIKIPTTVMAAVDASIGIKTAVNFNQKKNKLGTYCSPLAVFIDRSFLQTLDQRNLSNGSAEMLKMACIKDAELFDMLETHGKDFIANKFQGSEAGRAIRRSIQGMLEELEYNLWEHILCRLVDYGHTFSPDLEMAALASNDELLHGEAVNIDMALTTQLAYARGMISLEQRNRVFRVMHSLKLPFWHHTCNPEMFYKGLKDTTKARDGFQRVPLMDGIGAAVFVDDLTFPEIKSASTVLRTIAEANTFALDGPVVKSSAVPLPNKASKKQVLAGV